jgi:hypothetical protein
MSWPTVTADESGLYFRVFYDDQWYIVCPTIDNDDDSLDGDDPHYHVMWVARRETHPRSDVVMAAEDFWSAIKLVEEKLNAKDTPPGP